MFNKLILPEEDWVQVSLCLNRVHLVNMTPSQAIAKLVELGYRPDLRFQIDLDTSQLYLYAVSSENHLDAAEITDEKCQQLWSVFRSTSVLYVIGTGVCDRDKWWAICDLEEFAAKESEYNQYLNTRSQALSPSPQPQELAER